MSGKITGLEPRPAQVGGRAAAERTAGKSASAPGAAVSSAAHVQLTGSSVQLAALERALAQVPEVDLDRVKALKAQIESGEYRVDSPRIAARLLQLERVLAAVDPAATPATDVPDTQV